MSQDERRELAGLLAELDKAATPAGPDPYRIDPDVPDWAQVGNWGRNCAGQSLSSTPLAGSGLDEALPRSRAERRAAGKARQPA